MVCMVLAVFSALAAPAASASPELTENGNTVPVGASIKMTNTGSFLYTLGSGFPVECTHAEIKGQVTKNNGTSIAIEVPALVPTFSGTGTTSDCTSPLGSVRLTVTSKMCFASIAVTLITVTGCGGNITYSLHITGATTCKYSTASMSGTLPANTNARVELSGQEAKLSEPNIFCPSSAKIDGTLDLTTTDGTALFTS